MALNISAIKETLENAFRGLDSEEYAKLVVSAIKTTMRDVCGQVSTEIEKLSADANRRSGDLKQLETDLAALTLKLEAYRMKMGNVVIAEGAAEEPRQLYAAVLEGKQNLAEALVTLRRINGHETEIRLARFENAGQWAIHYSNIRMAVTTLAVGAAWSILTFNLHNLDGRIVVLAVVVWALGLGFFWLFTNLTLKMMARQQAHGKMLNGFSLDKDINGWVETQRGNMLSKDRALHYLFIATALYIFAIIAVCNAPLPPAGK